MVYRFAASLFAPALVSTTLETTERWSVLLGWRADEGVPPYRNDLTPAKVSLYSNDIPLGGRRTSLPVLSSLYLPLLNVISTEGVAVTEKSPAEVSRCPLSYNYFRPLKRCGVRDTAASVPAAFLLLFSPPEKSRISFPFLSKENVCYYFKSKSKR